MSVSHIMQNLHGNRALKFVIMTHVNFPLSSRKDSSCRGVARRQTNWHCPSVADRLLRNLPLLLPSSSHRRPTPLSLSAKLWVQHACHRVDPCLFSVVIATTFPTGSLISRRHPIIRQNDPYAT